MKKSTINRSKSVHRSVALGAVPLVAVALALAVARPALATPPSGVTSEALADGTFEEIDVRAIADAWRVRIDTRGNTDVHVVRNTVIPGGTFGWHSHPGPSLVIVVSGAATLYKANADACKSRVIEAPGTFVDEGDAKGHLVRNEGSVDLVVVVTRLVPEGAVQRTDLPNPHPGVCPE